MNESLVKPMLHVWELKSGLQYIALAILFAFCVRLVLGLLRASARGPRVSFWRELKIAMWGFQDSPTQGDVTKHEKDYLFPFYLGCLEFLSFPIFIFTDNLALIGAWITLKVAPQWKHWSEHRVAFNRFLIGTALVLVGSYVMAATCFKPLPPGTAKPAQAKCECITGQTGKP